MNLALENALKHCERTGIRQAVFAAPFPLTVEDILALKEEPCCIGMVLTRETSELKGFSANKPLGFFDQAGSWKLPNCNGALIFLGSQWMLTRKMILRVMFSGRFSVVCNDSGNFRKVGCHRFLIWSTGEVLRNWIRRAPLDSVIRRFVYRVAEITVIRSIWRKLFKRSNASSRRVGGEWEAQDKNLYSELFKRANHADETRMVPVPGRVILVNAGLGAGGAERQIVNTLIGLRDSGECESVTLLAEHIDYAPQLDFYLTDLKAHRIEVAQVKKSADLANKGLSALPYHLAELMAHLPGELLEEIIDLVSEFRERRPSVVHAWQDATSIKTGIAAIISGVPRVILGSRSVAPINFPYLETYMRPAYRALAEVESVVFLNNSVAGAESYCNWLGLDPNRFQVVRNGVDLGHLKRAEDQKVHHFCDSIGIPRGTMIVGSVFRLSEEKRPILWLESAALVAERHPEVHFVIIGEGPLRGEIEKFVREKNLDSSVHMPGTYPDIATPLTAMTVFVLTSRAEGTPNVVLEAQWLGLPVISTNAGGARESFDDGKTGWLIKDESANNISALISACLTNDAQRKQMSLNGPSFVEKNFGLDRMINETLRSYEMGPK